MPFITFIYRIGNNKKLFNGKYICDYISDDHEGLDSEIKHDVINGINKYRKQKGLSKINKICIGILSFSSDENIPIYSSKEEIKCFDFYYKNFNFNHETYINGKLIST